MRKRSRPCASAILSICSGSIRVRGCRPKAYGTLSASPTGSLLYRVPIIDYARRDGQRVDRVIRHVLIHEIGHHFGFSDVDMARIKAGALSSL